MDIIKHTGNLLEVTSGILVHGCSAYGSVTHGIDLQIRKKYPCVTHECKRVIEYLGKESPLGVLAITNGESAKFPKTLPTDVMNNLPPELMICSIFSQLQYSIWVDDRDVSYDALAEGFQKVNLLALRFSLPIHFPKIGTGVGGGDWNVIKSIIKSEVSNEVEKHLWELTKP